MTAMSCSEREAKFFSSGVLTLPAEVSAQPLTSSGFAPTPASVAAAA
jgi:hypothetical protein